MICDFTAVRGHEIWSNIIDFFSQRGFSIKTIDKSSGIIVTDDYSLLSSYTYEKNGKIENANAYVILSPKYKGLYGLGERKPDMLKGNSM